MNGVEAPEILAGEVGPERVLGGVAYIVAAIVGPGRIRFGASTPRIAVGALGGRRSAIAEPFGAACGRAGFECRVTENNESVHWEKLVLI